MSKKTKAPYPPNRAIGRVEQRRWRKIKRVKQYIDTSFTAWAVAVLEREAETLIRDCEQSSEIAKTNRKSIPRQP